MGRAARCLLFIYLFFSCVCRCTKDELFCCFFIIIYLNYSAPGCGRIPVPWDFPLGRDKYDIHLALFFCFVFSLRQQMSSFSNYNGPREPFFSLYGPKNIPLLKRIYFEIVEWQKISRKITCSAAANVIRQTRSSFFFLQTASTCSAESLARLLADVSFWKESTSQILFPCCFQT